MDTLKKLRKHTCPVFEVSLFLFGGCSNFLSSVKSAPQKTVRKFSFLMCKPFHMAGWLHMEQSSRCPFESLKGNECLPGILLFE